MSGIGAIFNRNGRPVEREEIERVARALTMYGPEKQVVRLCGPVAFAYTHFTNTPEAYGKLQPVLGAAGRYVMVFDGRLDNREDLARLLGIEADELRMLSDAELAMRCWERWSTDAFNRWVGEFAIIAWDAREQQLVAARHQLGMRALSYHSRPDRLVIASAPKGLHALSDIPREIDEQKIADALCQFYGDTGRSYFKDISRVPPAHMLVATPDKLDVRRYYDVKEHIRDIRYKRDDDYVEAARELLDTAVKACLRSPGPVGAFMSGGLDSSTVSVTAARMLAERGKRLPTFTWVPEPGWDGLTEEHCYGDETPFVRAIADQHPSIELNLVDAAGLGPYYKRDELLHACDAPIRNALNITWFHALLEKAKERGLRVMLEGGMGNLSLSYSGNGVLIHHWRSGQFRQLLRELSRIGGPWAVPKHALAHIVYPLGPDWLWNLKERLRGRSERETSLKYIIADPEFARSMNVSLRAKEAQFSFAGKPPADFRGQWLKIALDQLAGEMGDAYQGLRSMYALEMRDPLSDRRLFEWTLGVPEDQFRRDGKNRWLIRRLMSGILPKSVLWKSVDWGLQSSDWHVRLTRELDRMRSDVARLSGDPEAGRMIDIKRLSSLVEGWPAQTVTSQDDDRRFLLPVQLPMAMQVARFVERVKGTNSPDRLDAD